MVLSCTAPSGEWFLILAPGEEVEEAEEEEEEEEEKEDLRRPGEADLLLF